MKKINEIEACRDCSHVSPGGCAHEEIIKAEKNVKEIENWYSIPDWCELEDAPLKVKRSYEQLKEAFEAGFKASREIAPHYCDGDIENSFNRWKEETK